MKIGVFFGGKNTEHDVSILTGQLVISGLKTLGHEVVPVYITKEGNWLSDERMDNLDFFKSLNNQNSLKSITPMSLSMVEGAHASVKTGMFSKKDNKIDLAFPCFHGVNGEDGTIQGLFELLNIPYIGCDVAASAITMDKIFTKVFYQRYGFPTTKFINFSKHDWINKKDEFMKEIEEKLAFPLFVKPPRLGSSIGINKVKNKDELENAIEVCLHYDSKVLVEEGIENLKDLTVCLIGNDEPIASLIQESAYSKDFFSYEDKYLKDGGAQTGNAEKSLIIPANIDEQTTTEIIEMAKEIYKAIGCSGISRVDFLYDNTHKKFYANEINTLPGTIYHHLWKASGVELKELLSKLIEFAKEKYDQKQKLTYTFESDILKQSNSMKLKLGGGQ